jgi:ABC-2 type transport system permease protein
MSLLAMSLRQARYELKAFFRNPAAAFFTFVFPLMFLVIFNMVFGNTEIDAPGGEGKIDVSTFYVPAITAVSVIGACYINMAMGIAFARDRGVLKRIHGTPLPPFAYFAGRILMAIVISILLVVLILVVGIVAYGVDIQGDKMPAFILALVVGAASFCALGMAVACLVPNADAAPAIVQASILPLQFISNIYIPAEHAPDWVKSVAAIFPIVHFADALHASFNPFESGSGLSLTDVAVLAAWGVVGVIFAMKKFSWGPSR